MLNCRYIQYGSSITIENNPYPNVESVCRIHRDHSISMLAVWSGAYMFVNKVTGNFRMHAHVHETNSGVPDQNWAVIRMDVLRPAF